MKLLTTLSDYDWIEKGIADRGTNTNLIVAHCIPPIYPSYVRIFHSIYEDMSIKDRTLTWQDEDTGKVPERELKTEIEVKIAHVLSGSTLVYGGACPDADLKRIRWTALAERLGLRFSPSFSADTFTRRFPGRSWPRHLIGPIEGGLTGWERDALKAVLRGEASANRIFFRFWILATTHWDHDKMFEGTLEEVRHFPNKELGVCFTPTHWFPEDRSWVVCSDYDLTFSLVGGTESLIQTLLGHGSLECVRVASTSRLDTKADLEEIAW